MKLNIVKEYKTNKITSEHIMWFSVLVTFLILGLYIFKVIEPNYLLNIILIIAALMPIITNVYGNNEYFALNFEIESQFILNQKFINIDGNIIKIESIKKIEIEVNDWYGKKIVHNIRPFGSGPKLSRGINNILKYYCKDGSKMAIKFQLESENQMEELANWLRVIYKTKIELFEKYDHLKSYGLKHLNYSEIQDFRNKYAT